LSGKKQPQKSLTEPFENQGLCESIRRQAWVQDWTHNDKHLKLTPEIGFRHTENLTHSSAFFCGAE
jgi:hypothetical protein